MTRDYSRHRNHKSVVTARSQEATSADMVYHRKKHPTPFQWGFGIAMGFMVAEFIALCVLLAALFALGVLDDVLRAASH